MQVKVNQELCIGCGTCVSICPECFTVNGSNQASVVETCDCAANLEKINQAKDACPVQAISVE